MPIFDNLKGVSKKTKPDRYQVLWSHAKGKLNPSNYAKILDIPSQNLPSESTTLPNKTIFRSPTEAKDVADQLFRILVLLKLFTLDVRKLRSPTTAEIEKQRMARDNVPEWYSRKTSKEQARIRSAIKSCKKPDSEFDDILMRITGAAPKEIEDFSHWWFSKPIYERVKFSKTDGRYMADKKPSNTCSFQCQTKRHKTQIGAATEYELIRMLHEEQKSICQPFCHGETPTSPCPMLQYDLRKIISNADENNLNPVHELCIKTGASEKDCSKLIEVLDWQTKHSTSNLEGDSWNKHRKRWQVEVDSNGQKTQYYFENKSDHLDAIRTRNRVSKKMERTNEYSAFDTCLNTADSEKAEQTSCYGYPEEIFDVSLTTANSDDEAQNFEHTLMEEEEDYGVTNAKEKYMLEDKENYEVTDQECTDFIDLEESAWSINLNQKPMLDSWSTTKNNTPGAYKYSSEEADFCSQTSIKDAGWDLLRSQTPSQSPEQSQQHDDEEEESEEMEDDLFSDEEIEVVEQTEIEEKIEVEEKIEFKYIQSRKRALEFDEAASKKRRYSRSPSIDLVESPRKKRKTKSTAWFFDPFVAWKRGQKFKLL